MSNQSYCRYRNTLQDLRDCAEAIESEEFEETHALKSELSPEERQAKKALVELCQKIVDNFNS